MKLKNNVKKEIHQEILQLIIAFLYHSTHIIGVQPKANVFHVQVEIHNLIIPQMEQRMELIQI